MLVFFTFTVSGEDWQVRINASGDSKTSFIPPICQILVPTLSGLGVQATTEEVCNFAELC